MIRIRTGAFPLPHVASLALIAGLAGCTNVSLPGVGTDTGTNPTPHEATISPPSPDANGVITFPTYSAVRARSGDTVASIAQRLGVDPNDLASRNGLPMNATLNQNELLVLPAGTGTGNSGAAAGTDLAAMANSALNRAGGTTQSVPDTGSGPGGFEPVRHTVSRGETAYSIARLYNVSVKSLAEWNGLPDDYSVHEGQVLLVPPADPTKTADDTPAPTVTPPGTGSPTPAPPSASQPLPKDDAPAASAASAPAALAVAPLEDKQTKASDTSRLMKPVEGTILRPYGNGNEGVDFAAAAGSAVKAADAGTVAAITHDVDQVPIIVIRHDNGLLTVYANVDKITVAKDDKVTRGQQIGVVRSASPAFLHFEVRKGFESVDPVPYLTK